MSVPPEKSEEQSFADPPPGIPRWLKLSAVAVLLLIIVVVVIQLGTGSQHGPGMHTN
ncbi:MAG TPA: hypothetical protein VJ930_03490 [Acidimicrobiia bacterium]|nr:hypothetical protein [Acidimicrobiia bacterium]